ncbi:MAG: FAD-dependent oxidoreductase, partial [Bacteroidales bacterium]|nr:FAD-dependent oxidoreductase [Bacteroidales bacterium]
MNIKTLLSNSLFVLLLLLLTSSCENRQKSASNKQFSADVIIYGGNSSAVIAAVQVVKMGKEVILVSPDKHLGGLTSSGLGWTDTGNKAVIGGLSRDFYHRLYLHYQEDSAWRWQEKIEYGNKGQGNVAIDGENRTMWIFEPHAAELVFDQLVNEYKIPLHREAYLDRETGVSMKDGSIVSIRT